MVVILFGATSRAFAGEHSAGLVYDARRGGKAPPRKEKRAGVVILGRRLSRFWEQEELPRMVPASFFWRVRRVACLAVLFLAEFYLEKCRSREL